MFKVKDNQSEERQGVRTRPTRILYLIDKLVPAGTQMNLLEIVRHLDRTRFEPRVIAMLEGGPLLRAFEEAGTDPIVLHVKKAYDLSGWRAFLFLCRFMRDKRIEILQTHFLHADLIGILAGKMAGVKKIFTCRRDEGFWRSNRQLLLNRFLNRFADEILVNSDAVARAVMKEESFRRPIRRVYNGVDADRFMPDPRIREEARRALRLGEADIAIGVVANLNHEVKGHRFLIDAAKLVVGKHASARFFLIGDGSLRGALKAQAKDLGLEDHIVFLGRRTDTAYLLNAMDVCALPSLSEGFSNALLEYMAAGKAVVATRAGGNSEIIDRDDMGLLAEPKDAASLAEKMCTLIERKDLRDAMGHAARACVLSRFTLDRMARNYEKVYRHILRTKIMFIIWSLDLGGAEQVVLNLAQGIDRNDFEPMVCCLNEKGRYAPDVERQGIRVVALGKRPKFDPLLIPRLARLIRRERVRLVHTHLFTSNLWGRLACIAAGVPVVITEHNMDTWKKGFHFTLDRWLSRVSSRIIFVSEMVQTFYGERLPPMNGKARIIYNGIPTRHFSANGRRRDVRARLGIKENDFVIGTAGRLVPQKGHAKFIEAMDDLRSRSPNVIGLIIGDGELRSSLERCVREKHLEKHILFTGFRTDMCDLYQAMDIFAMSSFREGFPMTLLEAMATGVPVVSTDVGGISECVRPGKDGILVPPGDSRALAEALWHVMSDRVMRDAFAQNGRERVRNRFSVEHMTAEHERLYREVVDA